MVGIGKPRIRYWLVFATARDAAMVRSPGTTRSRSGNPLNRSVDWRSRSRTVWSGRGALGTDPQ